MCFLTALTWIFTTNLSNPLLATPTIFNSVSLKHPVFLAQQHILSFSSNPKLDDFGSHPPYSKVLIHTSRLRNV
ncbi:hypothetical protein M408DRAFT_327758, partial [Serendipita vermifera MAFF 305830]